MVIPLEMGWRHLLFENWPVDTDVMRAHVPDEFAVDEFDGSAWLSVVPLVNVAVRPKGSPERLGIRLPELNLRTYVVHDGVPSVYFFSLDAQGVASVVGARVLHHLPYFYARISIDPSAEGVRFASRRLHPGSRPAHYEATYRPTGDPFVSTDDPQAEFLTERHRLVTEGQDGGVRYTDVEHDPWTLYPAGADVERNTLAGAAGFAGPETDPVRYYSPGVDVATSPNRRAEK